MSSLLVAGPCLGGAKSGLNVAWLGSGTVDQVALHSGFLSECQYRFSEQGNINLLQFIFKEYIFIFLTFATFSDAFEL
jgi:hypothetical protein